MSHEIERRFKNFDYINVGSLLAANGFNRIGGFAFKISSYVGLKPGQTIRVRDEKDQITFTIKQRNQGEKYDTEWEVTVSDYNMMVQMMEKLNLEKKYELVKYREIFQDESNEVIFDFFPGLNPYMEIESKTEQDLKKTMEILGVNEEPTFTAKNLYWDEYGIPMERKDADLNFSNAIDALGSLITKNKNQFIDILEKQRKTFI
jgi:CYTH domain-containing protein